MNILDKPRRLHHLEDKIFKILLNLVMPFAAIMLSLVIGAVIIIWYGKDPIAAYIFLFKGAFGGPQEIAVTLVKSIPLIFTGLAMVVAFQGGVWNIGGEGQLQLGAIFAVWAGTKLSLPPILHISLAVMMGALGGLFWAAWPAILKIKRNFNVVITTILFSYIGVSLTSYLIGGPLRQTGWGRQTDMVQESARFPILVAGSSLHFGIFIAIVCVFLVYILLSKTTLGYQIRAVGLNERAARAAGIKVERRVYFVFLMSGMLCGLAGAVELLGYQYRLVDGFSPGFGWDGLAVAILGGVNPFGALLAAIIFGALRAGTNSLSTSLGLPLSINQLLQGLIVLFTLIGTTLRFLPRLQKRIQDVA